MVWIGIDILNNIPRLKSKIYERGLPLYSIKLLSISWQNELDTNFLK